MLERFFDQQMHGKSPSTRERYERVRRRLQEFLADGDMSRCLGTGENARLAAARRAGRGFFGVFGLEEMIACLGRFVDDAWLLPGRADARAQVMLAGRLTSWLEGSGTLDWEFLGCALYEAEAAIRAARERLRPPPRASSGPRLMLIRGGLAD